MGTTSRSEPPDGSEQPNRVEEGPHNGPDAAAPPTPSFERGVAPWSALVTFAGAIVAFVGGVIGLAVAFTKDRPASSVAVVALVLLLLIGWSIYAARARKPAGGRRFPGIGRRLIPMWGLTASTLVVVATVPALRGAAARLMGFPDDRTSVAVESAIVVHEDVPGADGTPDDGAAKSGSAQLLKITALVRNGGSRELIARRAGLTVVLHRPNRKVCRIKGNRVSREIETFAPHQLRARARAKVNLPGSSEWVVATGSTTVLSSETCGTPATRRLELSFPVQLVLPAHARRRFTIEVPSKFRITPAGTASALWLHDGPITISLAFGSTKGKPSVTACAVVSDAEGIPDEGVCAPDTRVRAMSSKR